MKKEGKEVKTPMSRKHPCYYICFSRQINTGPRLPPNMVEGMLQGLTWILQYLRTLGLDAQNVFRSHKISYVIRVLGLEDNRWTRTRLGMAFNYLYRNGWLRKYGKKGRAIYVPTPRLLELFDTHSCLHRCMSDSSICSLYSTPECPFLQGVDPRSISNVVTLRTSESIVEPPKTMGPVAQQTIPTGGGEI